MRSRLLLLSLLLCCLSSVTSAQTAGPGVLPGYRPPSAGGTMTGPILFAPDNTYDIGASGATRPRTVFVTDSVVAQFFRPASAAGGQRGSLSAQSDGVFTLMNNAGTDFSYLQFGGTTASFPALKRSGTDLQARLADDSGFTNFLAQTVSLTAGQGSLKSGSTVLISAQAPSSPTSCGTSPALTTHNGASVWVVTGGTGGTATGCTVTMPAALTGWTCSVNNITASAAHRAGVTTVQTASTTTSVTFEYQTVATGAATAFTASDVFRGTCFAY